MNDWPAPQYYPLEDEPAADPGLGRHAMRRGAPRHAAGSHPPWPGAGDHELDEDLSWSPPGGTGPQEYQDDDPGVQVPEPWSRPGADLPRRRPRRQAPSSRGRRPWRRFPRWLPAAGGAAVLITVIAVLTAHPGTNPSRLAGRGTAASPSPAGGTAGAGPQPVITRKAAQQVLARYASINDQANRLRSNAVLATIEAGSSYLLDAGTYRLARVTDPGNSKYFPLGLQKPVFYIPRQPTADWPHFFAVEVRWADLDSPPHVTSTGYLVFAQASPGGPWKDVIEPYLIPSVKPAPAIAVDAQGYAQPVSITTRTGSGLSAAPRQIQPDTISWLDREAAAGADPADTGGLSDLRDVIFWRGQLPSGTVTDTHSAGPGPAFGLRAKGGGAVFFYSLTARLRLLPPAGDTFRVTIPGYYSPGQTLRSATIGYIEQFAAFDPASGKGGPRAVAAASSIAGRG